MALQEEIETLTIRLPKGLKSLVEEMAKLRSTSLTNIVRESLQNALKPTGTIVQTPGMTAAFQEFIDQNNLNGRPDVLILVSDSKGYRYCFEGQIENNLTNPSVLTIASRNSNAKWVIPRHEIVGWFGGDRTNQLAMILQRNGWAFQ